jgi:hypothetical protein
VSSVDIAYSTNNGSTWTTVATGEPNDGSDPWTVDAVGTTDALIRVTATDDVGNSASDTSNATFTIDDSPPSVSSVTAEDTADRDGTAGDGVVNDGDELTVSASVSDGTSGVATVRVDASDFGAGTVGLTDPDGDGVYTGTVTVDAAAASTDGTYQLSVTAADRAGNTASGTTGGVELDTTAPSISGFSATNTGGKEMTVEFNADEEVADIGVTLSKGGIEVATLTESDFTKSGSTYTASYTVSGNGRYTATLNVAADETGNSINDTRESTFVISGKSAESIELSGSPSTAGESGSQVKFTLENTNSSEVTIRNITVVEITGAPEQIGNGRIERGGPGGGSYVDEGPEFTDNGKTLIDEPEPFGTGTTVDLTTQSTIEVDSSREYTLGEFRNNGGEKEPNSVTIVIGFEDGSEKEIVLNL